MPSAIVTFTARSREDILGSGGSRAWVLDRNHARSQEFLVCTRNANADWVEGDEPHRSAFLVGKISDVVPDEENPKRWLIKISEYAEVELPEVWQGWRNPVRYTSLEELGIDADDLEFELVPDTNGALPRRVLREPEPAALTIGEAKRRLAATLGVGEGSIEITIRG
ncbi:MAG: hypothetical protein ACQGVC_05340 [Myxococcota bacterium]